MKKTTKLSEFITNHYVNVTEFCKAINASYGMELYVTGKGGTIIHDWCRGMKPRTTNPKWMLMCNYMKAKHNVDVDATWTDIIVPDTRLELPFADTPLIDVMNAMKMEAIDYVNRTFDKLGNMLR